MPKLAQSILLPLLLCASAASAQGPLPTPHDLAVSEPVLTPRIRLVVGKSSFNSQVNAFLQDWEVIADHGARTLEIRQDPNLPEEAYRIEVAERIIVSASSPTGAAWGLQTLGQILSSGMQKASVADAPDTPFRCVMIDVARRYHSISTLRKIVRWAQLGKVRYIQLHLTDDQNWMLPTNVLPGIDKLNTHGRPTYTREELADLQEFATARGVTLIPEVEFPGHATLMCRFDPKQFEIAGSPSKNCINFASPEVRGTCKSILAEVAQIFTDAPYIHFGGDEAWYPEAEKDPHFVAALGQLGEKADANRVFADFVGEMAREVIRLKKTPLVWEGFTRSDFAKQRIPPETVVIAWENSYYPADQLVEDGYRVINAGWDPYYVVNHYPWDAFTLVPLERLYRHDPDVFGIVAWSKPEEASVRIGPGLWGSLMPWWEGHEWNTLAILPERILAFGSRLWNRNDRAGFADFRTRAQYWMGKVQRVSRPFDLVLDGVRTENPRQFTHQVRVGGKPVDGLRYGIRTDGKLPTPADIKDPVTLTDSAIVTIQAFRGSIAVGETEFLRLQKVTVVPNLAFGARAWSSGQEDPQFSASLVTDGVADDTASFWIGYPAPQDLTIDLGKAVTVSRIDVVAFYAARQGLQYRLSVSLDGSDWEDVADASASTAPANSDGFVHRFESRPARYLRVAALHSLQFPATMPRIHEVRAFNESCQG